MLKILIKKEILSHILSLRFAVAFVLITLFIFAGFYVSVIEYKQNVDEYHSTERLAQYSLERILKEENPDKRAERLLWYEGVTAAVPPGQLSVLTQGLGSVWPSAFNVVGARGTFNLGKSFLRNPLSKIFRIPDYVYIINMILSLFAILFIFDSVCGEKEAGTLRLMLSFSVPRHLILLSKWIGGFVVLIAPFLIATIGGIGYAWTKGALQLDAANLILVFMVVLTAIIYISVFFTLGLFISTLTKKAFTSLFMGLFVWVVLVLLVPNLAPIFGRIISPIPSPRKIEAEKAAVNQEIKIRLESLGKSSDVTNGNEMSKKLTDEGKYRKDQWDRFLRNSKEKQTGISGFIGRISPSSSWIYSSNSLTKTGPDAYRNIIEGRDRLGKDLDVLTDKVRESWQTKRTPLDIKANDIPNIRIQFYDTSKAITASLNDLLLLIIFNILFFMAAFMKFLRYDVR